MTSGLLNRPHQFSTQFWFPSTEKHRIPPFPSPIRAAGIRDLRNDEETCFVIVMPAHIDAVLGKLLAVGGRPTNKSPSPGSSSRLLRTKLFRPQAVSATDASVRVKGRRGGGQIVFTAAKCRHGNNLTVRRNSWGPGTSVDRFIGDSS